MIEGNSNEKIHLSVTDLNPFLVKTHEENSTGSFEY
jgi:hypothetical protein